MYRVIPTKLRSYRDHRLGDVTSLYVYSANTKQSGQRTSTSRCAFCCSLQFYATMRGTSWRIRWKFVTHTRPVCSVLAPLREDMTSSRKPTRAPRQQVSTENHTKIGHSVSEICDCRQTNGVTEIQICRHVYRNYCAPFLEAKQNATLWKFVDTIVL